MVAAYQHIHHCGEGVLTSPGGRQAKAAARYKDQLIQLEGLVQHRVADCGGPVPELAAVLVGLAGQTGPSYLAFAGQCPCLRKAGLQL